MKSLSQETFMSIVVAWVGFFTLHIPIAEFMGISPEILLVVAMVWLCLLSGHLLGLIDKAFPSKRKNRGNDP